ncbi:hypothetical protein ACN47E_004955 [Coniothyrium glycines]
MTVTVQRGVDAETTTPKSQEPHTVETPPRTPTGRTTAAYQLLTRIQSSYDALEQLPSLAPGERVNTILTDLVDLCIQPLSGEQLTQLLGMNQAIALFRRLRPLCAMAEGELEQYWARRIIQAARSSDRPAAHHLSEFPYVQNYIDLSRLECSTLDAFLSAPPQHVAFIGSGPLPLTSLCMRDRYPHTKIHNIDRDESALQISQDLCKELGYDMSFAREDVSVDNAYHGDVRNESHATDWQTFDVVFLAALVGMDTPSKLAILSTLALKLRPGTLVVARSARGLRSVLYPILELSEDIEEIGYEVLVEVHPWTKVVNSVIVLRVKRP